MAIFTQFGTPVKVIAGNLTTGEVNVKYIDNGDILQTHIKHLRAEGGLDEIYQAIKDSGKS